jgi:glycosyltransferase involved in cell wall biosynthesis
VSITVSVHGRFHAFELARGLFKRGLLQNLLTTYPAFMVKRILDVDLPVRSAANLEILRRIIGYAPIKFESDLFISKKFGKFAARQVEQGDEGGILVGWSSATLEAMKPAHSMGKLIIIERGSTHIKEQMEILKLAYSEIGLNFAKEIPEIVAREEAEYELADKISVPSSIAAKSFFKRGFPKDKILINSLGVDLGNFNISKERRDNIKPRILFAGEIGVRKGVPWLLKAFKKLSKKSDLYLFGNVEKNFKSKLYKLLDGSVKICGPVSMKTLAIEYQKADIFCLPSIEEGFGLVVLQAMASGLPVVITESVGASDIVTEGKDGFIIPKLNVTALSEALESLIDDNELRSCMGEAAAKRVKSGCSWEDYEERIVKNYGLHNSII